MRKHQRVKSRLCFKITFCYEIAPSRTGGDYLLRVNQGAFNGHIVRLREKDMSMKLMRCKTLASLVLLVLVPQLTLAATPKVEAEKPARLPVLTDIALQKGGILVGRLTDDKGKLRGEQKIIIRQENQLVAEVTTGKNGQFMVEGLQGGIYEIASDKGAGSFRAWATDTAPPSAKQFAVLIEGDEVVRGQWGWVPTPGSFPSPNFTVGEWIGITLGAAGLVVGTIALVDAS
jgi:hypothetical protein